MLHELVWRWIRCASNLSFSKFPCDLYSTHKRQIRLLYTVSGQGGAVRTSGQKGNHGHHKSKIWLYPYVCIYDAKIHVGEIQQKMCKLMPKVGCSTLYLGGGPCWCYKRYLPNSNSKQINHSRTEEKKKKKKSKIEYHLLKTHFFSYFFSELNFILELISTHYKSH